MFTKEYKDCYAKLDPGSFTIGNGKIERVYDMTDDRPIAISLINKESGREWLATEENSQFEGGFERKFVFYKAGITEGRMQVDGIEAKVDNDCGISQEYLEVTVYLNYGQVRLAWIHQIYPEQPFIRTFVRVQIPKGFAATIGERTAWWPSDYYDCLMLNREHMRWDSVAFYDRTDNKNNLVQENHGLYSRRENLPVIGNLLFTEDSRIHDGILQIKEGPTPFAYLGDTVKDYHIWGLTVFTSGWGFGLEELARTDSLTTYGSTVLVFDQGHADGLRRLHDYHRTIRTYVPERDAVVMANTWGDGNADGRISEEFLLNELRRAKELDIDFYQIDDGWQQGATVNSVKAAEINKKAGGKAIWGQGYYKADPDFWTVNKERLPNGLEPVVAYAGENGIRLGLWFSPDSVNDFENWYRDSEVILGLYKRYGIRAFKMDGLFFRSKIGEENFIRFARRVVTESDGQILFNIDTTAGRRNGYFGRVQYGSLFLENRFTNKFGNWPNYWPHLTLRNLWTLSRYLTTEKIQVEFLNVYRNQNLYGNDPLSPYSCGTEYAFAISMFATPLVWMELTGLPEEAVRRMQPIIRTYRELQADILSGYVQPIGAEPDGTSWTGFISEKGNKTGFLMIFREYNKEDHADVDLYPLAGKKLQLTCLIGSGRQKQISVDKHGFSELVLEQPHSFALYRYEEC